MLPDQSKWDALDPVAQILTSFKIIPHSSRYTSPILTKDILYRDNPSSDSRLDTHVMRLINRGRQAQFIRKELFQALCVYLLCAFPGLINVDAASITVRILDENGETTPARAWVESKGQRLFEPFAPITVTPYARDRSFSCDGVFTMDLPEGEAVVHVEKGKEYIPVDLSILLGSGENLEKTVQLSKWIDMPSEGWFSADLHVHLGQDDPRILQQLALADDVHLIPAFSFWLRGRGETWESSWPDASYTLPIEVDRNHIVTRNNIEIERIDRNAIPGGTIGATFLYNLNLPVTAEVNGEHFPTDAALSRSAQSHSPDVVLDSDKPSWAETVIGAALGALDTIQVCHNHYHRDSTIPGGWGMIGALTSGESNEAVGDGLFHRTNGLYYRFLNCGFRLGVSGGSAIGVMPVAAGQHRVYAKIDGRMTAAKFWEALKSGRSFATSGPMLSLTADGQGLGTTVTRSSANTRSIKLLATVRSIESLESLQIVHNGLVVASLDLLGKNAAPVLIEELNSELLPQRSGWVIARAFFRAPDGLLRQAHTSPIYISVDQKPIAFVEDAEYMLRWIEVLDSITRKNPDRFPGANEQDAVLANYAEARAVYSQVIKDAEYHWADK
ncbi:MAG: CehA/McbA family metallohydrolase [Verrucomicrobia bacterium]|nr:CehA/McbA family metallohydrolase [Verrucomicrobiota bacterium]